MKLSKLNTLKCMYADFFKTSVLSKYKFYYYFSTFLSYVSLFLPFLEGVKKYLVVRFPNKYVVIRNSLGTFKVKLNKMGLRSLGYGYEYWLKSWLVKGEKNLFIDIGANRGIYAISSVVRYGYKKAIAFEPSADNIKECKTNIALSKVSDHVILVEKGLSDSKGTLFMKEFSIESGLNKVVAKRGKGVVPIKVTTLDSYIFSHEINCSDISYIKMDVEGHELKVLKGSVNVLKKTKPGTRLVVEVWENSLESKDIFNILNTCGFVLKRSYGADKLFVKKK